MRRARSWPVVHMRSLMSMSRRFVANAPFMGMPFTPIVQVSQRALPLLNILFVRWTSRTSNTNNSSKMTDNALNALHLFMLNMFFILSRGASMFSKHFMFIPKYCKKWGTGRSPIWGHLWSARVYIYPGCSPIETSFIWLVKQFFRKLCRRWSVVWGCSVRRLEPMSKGQPDKHKGILFSDELPEKQRLGEHLPEKYLWWKLNLTVFWL